MNFSMLSYIGTTVSVTPGGGLRRQHRGLGRSECDFDIGAVQWDQRGKEGAIVGVLELQVPAKLETQTNGFNIKTLDGRVMSMAIQLRS
jgi:hypothetical protein